MTHETRVAAEDFSTIKRKSTRYRAYCSCGWSAITTNSCKPHAREAGKRHEREFAARTDVESVVS